MDSNAYHLHVYGFLKKKKLLAGKDEYEFDSSDDSEHYRLREPMPQRKEAVNGSCDHHKHIDEEDQKLVDECVLSDGQSGSVESESDEFGF